MKKIRKNNLKRRHEKLGSIQIVGMTIMVSILLLAVPFLLQLSPENRVTDKSSSYSAAFSLAEAGVERAIRDMNHGDISSWKGDSRLRTITISSFKAPGGNMIGDIEVKIEEPDGENPVVKSTGRVTYTDHLKKGKKARVVVERTTRVELKRNGYSWASSIP